MYHIGLRHLGECLGEPTPGGPDGGPAAEDEQLHDVLHPVPALGSQEPQVPIHMLDI